MTEQRPTYFNCRMGADRERARPPAFLAALALRLILEPLIIELVMHRPTVATAKSDLLETLGRYVGIFCGMISVGILWIFLGELLGNTPHPLYSSTSLAEVFVASIVMLYFSLQRSIVHVLSAVFISIWYTLRVFVTYFAPERLEYSAYQSYTQNNIELATRYLMFFSLALLLASLLHAVLYPGLGPRPRNGARTAKVSDKISFFGIRVDFHAFLWAALLFTVFATFFRVYAFASGYGIRVGEVYQADMYLLRVAQSLSFPFYLLAMFGFCLVNYKSIRRVSVIVIGLIILDGILATSRGWVVSFIANYVICACVLGLAIARRTKVVIAMALILTLLVVFPAMTLLRPLMLVREYISVADYFDLFLNNITSVNLLDVFLFSMDRFAGFDWLALWANVEPSNIPPNVSLWGEVVDIINRFVPGEIITIPGNLQLNKLQAFLGGSAGRDVIIDIDELGGHGDVTGGVAAFLIFFGPVSGLIAACVWLFALLRFERSNVHALHKVYIYQVYIQSFIVGGGWVLLPNSFFWYLIVSLVIAFTIRFISPCIAWTIGAQRAH